MQSKTFEIRDNGTLIPVLAVKLAPANEADRCILEWSGYGSRPETQANYVLLAKLFGGRGPSTCDPADWRCTTMEAAHDHICKHFDSLASGAVVDAEYIRGEVTEASTSDVVRRSAHVPASTRTPQRRFVPSEKTIPGADENRHQSG